MRIKLICILAFALLFSVSLIAAQDLSVSASDAIKQRALDISGQIEIYLDANPEMNLEDLVKDLDFQRIAVQQVGDTGYTYLIVKETGILEFHPDPDIRGGSYNNFEEEFPVIWKIIDKTIRSQPCQDSSGFYDWRDIEDNIREKYTYHHCIEAQTSDGHSFFIGSSTYLDEYVSDEEEGVKFYLIFFVGLAVLFGLVIIFLIFRGRGSTEEKVPVKAVLFGKINRKFIFIFGIVLFTIILIGGLIVYFQDQVLEDQFFAAVSETEEDFLDIQQESIRTLSVALEVVLQDEGMKQIYLEKDREKFFDYGQPLFRSLKEKYGITHFYFILPDGINFVRLHNKDVFGDEIKRDTFLESKRTKGVGAGIELGKTAYALRVVMPYYNGDDLIGYVELGQEIDEFLEIMKKGKSNEFALFVEKDSLDSENWASTREVRGLRDNWGDLGGHIKIAGTTEEVFSCFSDENVNLLEGETSLLGNSVIDDAVFACGGFSLVDASGDVSGAVFSLIDVSEEQSAVGNIRYILLALLAFFVVMFIGIGFYVSRKISKPITELNLAAVELQKKNFKVKTNIDTGDELQALGETFNEAANVLDKMDAEHKQLDKAKTEFLSITSHELRSPMTPMQAQLQMLIGDYYGKLTPKQKQALEIVSRNTKRLDNIIVDFLEISRIEAARLKFRFVRADPAAIVPRLAKEMVGFMPEKKIKIVNKIGKLPVIEHDPDRLGQILRNLINNAIKFSKPGAIVIVSAKVEGNMILFSVKDQGIGIKQSEQKRLFEPFFQAEQTMYREHQGTGLGLAIVKGIVESQEGKIWIESEEGKGSTFNFTLPLKPVKHIRPIKLLFSEQENKGIKIKRVFIEVLGPMAIQEFEALERKNQINKKDLVWYVDLLKKKGVLSEEKAEIFKAKILGLFGEKVSGVGIEKDKKEVKR